MFALHRALRAAPCIGRRPVAYGVIRCIASVETPKGNVARSQDHQSNADEKPDKASKKWKRNVSKADKPPRERQAYSPRYDNGINTTLDGEQLNLSPILMRDLCTCAECVDVSTKQKHFSTVDIPSAIRGDVIKTNGEGLEIQWTNDIKGYGSNHTTRLSNKALKSLVSRGNVAPPTDMTARVLWDDQQFRNDVQDITYDSYMQDDAALLTALEQLHTHGLMFLTNVPEAETSVSTIAERIGPLKNTFYGMTWDVRSVPQAKNVAYTAGDLGFHMDLLYMKQPPHLQLLHCIRSSSAGGASTFTDSFKAAADLFVQQQAAFVSLSAGQLDFHYNHPESHYYRQSRTVIETKRLRNRGRSYSSLKVMLKDVGDVSSDNQVIGRSNIAEWIDAISWAPPFQAPFSADRTDDRNDSVRVGGKDRSLRAVSLGNRVHEWHAAAQEFSKMIHRPEGIHERMMKPGECVIFDNRRVLHARRAFEVGDVGKERWLRGAYLDKDPYMSKLKALQYQLKSAQNVGEPEDMA